MWQAASFQSHAAAGFGPFAVPLGQDRVGQADDGGDRLLGLGDRVTWVRGNADRELVELARGQTDDVGDPNQPRQPRVVMRRPSGPADGQS